jgi:hypothetical protein
MHRMVDSRTGTPSAKTELTCHKILYLAWERERKKTWKLLGICGEGALYLEAGLRWVWAQMVAALG